MTENTKACMADLKQRYHAHLKELNPSLERTYLACRPYYQAEISPLLPRDLEARVLDLGCGFGHLIRFLLEKGYRNSGGVELDGQLYADCRAQVGSCASFLENVSAQQYLQGRRSSFDLIVATDVIEHFPLDEALDLAGLICNALRPGGRIILRTPNMANIFGAYSRCMDLTHQIGFTEQSLAQLLLQAGFQEPQLHLPDWSRHPHRLKFMLSTQIQRCLFALQDRSMARCFDKNLVMWAVRQ